MNQYKTIVSRLRSQMSLTNILLLLIFLSMIIFGYWNSLSSIEKFLLNNKIRDIGITKEEVPIDEDHSFYDCGEKTGIYNYWEDQLLQPKKVTWKRFGIVYDQYYDLGVTIPSDCQCVNNCPTDNLRTIPAISIPVTPFKALPPVNIP